MVFIESKITSHKGLVSALEARQNKLIIKYNNNEFINLYSLYLVKRMYE